MEGGTNGLFPQYLSPKQRISWGGDIKPYACIAGELG